MATVTTNYGLTKPAPEDFYDITVHNGNMEIIDTELKRVATAAESGSSAVKNHGMIVRETDLNDLTEVGFYHVNSNEWAMSLANCPTTMAFFLEVGEHAGVYQRIVEFATEAPKVYFRNYYSFTNTWSEWFREYTTSDKPKADDVDAVPKESTNMYNFTNKGLNGVNIDEVYNYNYVVAISENGHGTRPSDSWFNIINFYTGHFVSQIAVGCLGGGSSDRRVGTWVRERYQGSGNVWSDWKRLYNTSNIISGTSDLTAGTSTLNNGDIYLVYE